MCVYLISLLTVRSGVVPEHSKPTRILGHVFKKPLPHPSTNISMHCMLYFFTNEHFISIQFNVLFSANDFWQQIFRNSNVLFHAKPRTTHNNLLAHYGPALFLIFFRNSPKISLANLNLPVTKAHNRKYSFFIKLD